MNKNQITATGVYEYKEPSFAKPIFVSVYLENGELFVYYSKNSSAKALKDVSVDAIFSKWI